MKIKEMSYKRIRNLGNYETSSLEGTIELDPGDDPHASFEYLRNFIHYKLGLISKSDFIRLTGKDNGTKRIC